MNQETINQLLSRLDSAGVYAIEQGAKAVYYNGLAGMIASGVLFILSTGLILFALFGPKGKTDNWGDNPLRMIKIPCGISACAGYLVMLISFGASFASVFAPEGVLILQFAKV